MKTENLSRGEIIRKAGQKYPIVDSDSNPSIYDAGDIAAANQQGFISGAEWALSLSSNDKQEKNCSSGISDVDLKYGDYVQMDDRFESVHIWSKELEERNAGRWIPKKISKDKYDEEMKKSWNK